MSPRRYANGQFKPRPRRRRAGYRHIPTSRSTSSANVYITAPVDVRHHLRRIRKSRNPRVVPVVEHTRHQQVLDREALAQVRADKVALRELKMRQRNERRVADANMEKTLAEAKRARAEAREAERTSELTSQRVRQARVETDKAIRAAKEEKRLSRNRRSDSIEAERKNLDEEAKVKLHEKKAGKALAEAEDSDQRFRNKTKTSEERIKEGREANQKAIEAEKADKKALEGEKTEKKELTGVEKERLHDAVSTTTHRLEKTVDMARANNGLLKTLEDLDKSSARVLKDEHQRAEELAEDARKRRAAEDAVKHAEEIRR